ncbi:SAM-dependent methyltransferase [Photobacterium lipolyticum]|uniref:SAM-dependent methyltransferase n=1 Tax=Photobacterium lipolyticum TaxID=266810 RepID=A0A2T3N0B0_9GAMM|nr:SAM-dependent methyltransferase [Photobacterium lipolyticum]PSW05668.1 SAM-dependent methyltransferase [Photobacterium lipolyticum]
MNQLFDHNQTLKSLYLSLVEDNDNDNDQIHEHVCLDSIDGVLRSVLSIEEMKDAGSFFTGDELAIELSNKFDRPITDNAVILDPTCGAGNLLLACSRQLGICETLSNTLTRWGHVLRGYDLYSSFVEATKLRIILEAVRRGCELDCSLEEALELLPNIKTADAMTISSDDVLSVSHAVMNPPFSSWESPKVNFWKQGKVNAAGVVFEHFLRILPRECEFSAILPEVLRSGTRYQGWRDFVQNSAVNASIHVVGRFNSKTDVDVFIVDGRVAGSEEPIDWLTDLTESSTRIGDYFDVSVGRLVAYRDLEEGEQHPYIHPKNLPAWSTVKEFSETRRFDGTVFKPPFVVIRRTSSPSDRYRAVGTIIGGRIPVAVENHLIVIKPGHATLVNCRKLLKVLKSSQTNDFLNDRIRCRHLTVGAVKQIPYLG